MKRFSILFLLAAAFALTSCEGKEPEEPTEENNAPTSITLSPSSMSVSASGGSTAVTIVAPSRPVISDKPDWVSVTDGPYNSETYKQTITLTVAENTEYEARSASLSFSATGASSVAFSVSQEAAEKPVEPEDDPDDPEDPGNQTGTNDAWAMSASLGLGWNMGNHFDAYYNGTWAGDLYNYPSETAWGSDPATPETFVNVKKAGFTSVRIPVTWLNMIGEAPDYKIDETWMNRVYEVVGYAEAAGLKVIINTHHDENHGDDHWLDVLTASKNSAVNEEIKAEIKAVWTQIAEKFNDKGDFLIFESFNEINDGGWGWSSEFRANPSKQCNILNEWNQVFVDAVRATEGNNETRWLGVPTYCASPNFIDYLTIPDDPAGKIMVSVHFYDPNGYTISNEYDSDGDGKGDSLYPEWGHTGTAGKKASWGDEDHVKDTFNKLKTKYIDNNIPVYLGEFGCSMRPKSDARQWNFFLYYLEYVVKAAKTYGMPCFLWDNGAEGSGTEQHGYINHGTGSYIGNSKEAIDVMVEARFNEDSGYTLQTVYNSAP